jgi:hypothetical protein
MKTNANVSSSQMQNTTETMRKVNVNPAMLPEKGIAKKPKNSLSIQGYALREWLEHLTGSNGLYFLDISNTGMNSYSLHFKHHASGKLMELDCQEGLNKAEDPKKEFLEALLFDLSLFPDEPILAFDSDQTENALRNLSAIYCEFTKSVENIIGRLVNVDLKKVFESGIYTDPRIKEISVDGIYHGLNPGSSRTFAKEQSSYGQYLIFLAIQSIFYQITGKKVQA